MKKFMLLIVTIVVLGAFALPAAAVPVSDLTGLAGFYPQGSVLYASVRTDDDFVNTLDGALAQLAQAVPEVGGISLTQALDMVAMGIKQEATFQEVFRSWLGDTAAAGVMPLTMTDEFGQPLALVAISITDRDGAEAFFTSNTRVRDYAQTEGDDITTYEHLTGNTHVAFRDDVLLIASDFSLFENGGLTNAPLSSNDGFVNTVNLLPESDYNALVYLDTPALLDFTNTMTMGQMGAAEGAFLDALQTVEPQVLGFTIQDGGSFTIDGVTSMSAEAMGASAAAMMTPLDLALIERIPAGTPLVILGTNLSDGFNLIREQLTALAAMQDTGMGFDSGANELETGLWALEFAVRGFTGLNLQDEILPAFNGTFALTLGVNPAVESAQTAQDLFVPELLIDFALMAQASDAATAATLRDNLLANLRDLPAQPAENFAISFEEIAGTEVAVLTLGDARNDVQIDVLLAVNDELFVLGSRRYVEAALNPDVSLSQDPHWQAAAAYFTGSPYTILYQSSDNLAPLVRVFEQTGSRDARDVSDALDILTSLVDSSSITYGTLENGGTWTRAVLTVNGD